MNSEMDLSKLLHDEICEVRIKGSAEFREARWRPASRLFFFIDGDQRDYCTIDQVAEWRPAGVPF
ncbi:MAG TPA: hypothetical protein VJ652_22795 [Noviherbaspirillum sp.]|nr:hypothetical protein [Noviherbaspirillum sp.]